MLLESITEADRVINSGDQKLINDRGYSIEMNSNIMDDLKQAALNYSMLTMEKTIKVNTAEVARKNREHAARMQREKFIHEESMKKLQKDLNLDEYREKKEIDEEYGTTGKVKNVISKLLGIGGDTKLVQEEGIEEIKDDKSRMDYELEQISFQQEKLVNDEINTYLQIAANGNLIDVTNYDLPNDISKKVENDKIYISKDNFRKLLNDKNLGQQAYDKFTKELYDKITNAGSSNTNSSDNSKIEYLKSLQERKQQLKKQVNKFYETAEDQLRIVRGIEGIKAPSPIQEDENKNLRFLSKEDFIKTIKSSDHYYDNYYDSKKFGSTDPNNPLTYNFNTSRIRKDVEEEYRKTNKLPDDFIVERVVDIKDGKKIKRKMFNSKYFYIIQGSRFSPERKNLPSQSDILVKAAGGQLKASGYLKMWGAENKDLIDKISESYDVQLKKLNEVQRGEYIDPSESGKPLAFKYYSFTADKLDLQDPLAQLPTLLINKKKSIVLNNSQYTDLENIKIENANDIPESIKQAMFLEDAMNNATGNVKVSTITDTGYGEGWKKDKEIKTGTNTEVLQILDRHKTGQLEGDIIIEYIPNIEPEGESEYRIINTKDKDATQEKPFGYPYSKFISVKIPNQFDRNELNPLNDKTNYVVDSLLDDTSDSYDRNFADNSNIFISKDGGNYNFDIKFSRYDEKKDDFVFMTEEQINTAIKGFGRTDVSFSSIQKANEFYEGLVNQLTRWSTSQLKRRENFQTYYKQYLLNKGFTEEDIKNNKDTPQDWDNFIKSLK